MNLIHHADSANLKATNSVRIRPPIPSGHVTLHLWPVSEYGLEAALKNPAFHSADVY